MVQGLFSQEKATSAGISQEVSRFSAVDASSTYFDVQQCAVVLVAFVVRSREAQSVGFLVFHFVLSAALFVLVALWAELPFVLMCEEYATQSTSPTRV